MDNQKILDELFEKHKATIIQELNSGFGLRKICFGYDGKENPEGDPNKAVERNGGISDFIEFAKRTNTFHNVVGGKLWRLCQSEQDKKLDKHINNNSDKSNTTTGLVGERFEVCSIIAQLAGRSGYAHDSDREKTTYQTVLTDNFKKFGKHSAIEFLQKSNGGNLCYNAIFCIAMALKKTDKGFVLGESENNVNNNGDGRVTADLIKSFLPHLNSFYDEASFGEWFENNAEFYREFSKKFGQAQTLDYAWFEKFGVKKENMQIVASPSNSMNNYGATLGDKTFALVQGSDGALVHEFCHSFCNSLAKQWFNENPRFREMCEQTMGNPRRPSSYNNPQTLGYEYITRAFDIIYQREHLKDGEDWETVQQRCFENDKMKGFEFIAEALEIAKKHNKAVNQGITAKKQKDGGIDGSN